MADNKNQVAEAVENSAKRDATPQVSSLDVANALVDRASFQQAVDLAGSYQNQAVNNINSMTIKSEIDIAERQLQATRDLQDALDEQTEYYSLPAPVRLIGQLFNGKLSDEYHEANVSGAASKVQALEQEKQINKSVGVARAQDALGYNVIADPMVDKARGIMKDLNAQDAARQRLAIDKESLAIAREKNALKAKELRQKATSPENLKKQIELADYQVTALTNEAKAKELLANRQYIESMNMGALKTPDVDLGFRLLESSANQPEVYKNSMLKQGIDTLTEGLKRQVDMLPTQLDKDMVTTRIENQGLLRSSDTSMASNYYFASIGQRSATASIEGSLFEKSKNSVTNNIKAYYDQMSDKDKNTISSESGLSGNLSAIQMMELFSTAVNKPNSEIKKLIPYNDLLAKSLNEPRKVVDSTGTEVVLPSPKVEYANSLALDYGRFYTKQVANTFSPKSRMYNNAMVIANQPNSTNNQKLKQLVDLFVANGADYSSVANLISGYADQATVDYWSRGYKAHAATYDNQAAAMMPLLDFDGIVVSLTNKLRDKSSNMFYEKLLTDAKSAIDQRQANLNQQLKAQDNGRKQ